MLHVYFLLSRAATACETPATPRSDGKATPDMPRRTAEEAAATRAAVLAAARSHFTDNGYAEASTTEIAEAAGVTRGALYHHFADKQDLFREVFVDLEHELDRTVRAAAIAEREPRAAFIAGCRAWLDFSTRTDYQRIALADAPAVLGIAEWHAIDAGIGLRSVQLGLDALAAAGVIERSSPGLAVLLFGALTEAGLAAARNGDSPDADVLMAEFVYLLDRLGSGNGGGG